MSLRRNERGVVLAIVLWVIAALSLIAIAMLASAMNAQRIGHNAWAQLQVQTAADEGIQRAILSLFDPGRNTRTPLDGAQRQISLDDVAVTIAIQDEAGRIDLNYAGRRLLHDLFVSAGAGTNEADTLAGRVLDWRSGTKSPGVDDDSRGAGSYTPRGGPFQSVDELKLVAGMTPELFARVEPALTVYSHSASFDMRSAPKEVLEVIPGMNPGSAQKAVDARSATPTLPGATSTAGTYDAARQLAGHAFAITAEAQRGHTRFSRRAVVLISGDPRRPYWVLDWK